MSPNAMLTSAYVRATSGQRVSQAHRFCLFPQIRVLAARHLVDVNFGRCRTSARCRTACSKCAPSPNNRSTWFNASKFKPVSRSVCASAATIEFRFGWLVVPLMARDGAVRDMHAGFRGLQHRRRVDAAGVVRVEVNRQARSPRAESSPACKQRRAATDPAMSLMPRTCAPMLFSSFASRT